MHPHWYAITLQSQAPRLLSEVPKTRTALVRAYTLAEAKQQADDGVIDFLAGPPQARPMKAYRSVAGRPAFADEIRRFLARLAPEEAKPLLDELELLAQVGNA